ncbi:MAG: hypothetical protein IJK22_02900 [Bacteroidales bacterium]|nr:hypothetical protein [Bacteroidales bacterium]
MDDDKTIIDSTNNKNRNDSGIPVNEKTKRKEKVISKKRVAGIAAGGAVLGAAGAAIPFFAFGKDTVSSASHTVPTEEEYSPDETPGTQDVPAEPVGVDPASNGTSDLPVASCVTDGMTFNEAFAAAREEVGPGGIFYYHGHAHGTYYESEWNSMTQDEKEEYWSAVQHTHEHHSPSYDENTEQQDLELVDAEELPYMYIVDANGNDMVDAIFDLEHDGVGDVLMVDIEVENGDIVSVSDTYVGEFHLDQWNLNINDDDDLYDNDYDLVVNDDQEYAYNDYDYSANTDLDDDIYIENDIDTSDMI